MASPFTLTLLVGPGVPVPAPRDVVDALTAAEVTVSSGQRSGFQLTFAVAKDSVITRTLLPAGYFDPGVRVILVATVRGIPHVLSDGIVTRQESTPANDPGQATLTVTGEDLSVLMDVVDFQIPYGPLPDVAIAALILVKYAFLGIVPLVVPPLYTHVSATDIKVQSGTDLQQLKAMASRSGYVFYLDPGPAPGANLAYWGPEIRVGVPQPALSVNMDAETNVESLSFSYDGLSKTLPILFVQLPEVKLPLPIPVPDVAPWRPPLAVRPAMPLKIELTETASMSPGDAIMYGLAIASRSSDAVSASGTLDVLRYGRPLKARGLVGVRGGGPAYDGLYFVKSVTHSIKRGEYTQNFSLAREGLISNVPRVLP